MLGSRAGMPAEASSITFWKPIKTLILGVFKIRLCGYEGEGRGGDEGGRVCENALIREEVRFEKRCGNRCGVVQACQLFSRLPSQTILLFPIVTKGACRNALVRLQTHDFRLVQCLVQSCCGLAQHGRNIQLWLRHYRSGRIHSLKSRSANGGLVGWSVDTHYNVGTNFKLVVCCRVGRSGWSVGWGR